MATATEPTQSVKTKGRILIVDDELVVRDSLGKWFTSEGYTAKPVGGAREALETIQQQQFDIALIDIKMPGMDGMELQARLREADPDLTVVIMTGYASVETAVQALKHGAYDYITKPVDPDELSHLVIEGHGAPARPARSGAPARKPAGSAARNRADRPEPGHEEGDRADRDGGAHRSHRADHGRERHRQGSGGARDPRGRPAALHADGHDPLRRAHRDAARKRAVRAREGRVHRARSTARRASSRWPTAASVFLDEISDISLKTQTDLLRVLQEKEIVRVGGNQQIKVDFRCIAATNKNLETLVKAGSFRPDLYYRLHVFCIELPPLRDRREDIPLLVNHFLNKFCMATSRAVPQITPEALDLLMRHDWPGNVRELENAVERALVVGRGTEVRPADFSFQFQADEPRGGKTLEDIERVHIERILRETQHNLSRAARILDIDRTTLYNKLRRYGLR